MSEIQTYLDEIRHALYGEEVRQSIINAINQCYQDAADGVKPTIEFSEVQNGTRVTIRVGDEADSFNVINGARTQLATQRYTSASVTCAANSNGNISVPVAFPTGYDFVAVIDAWSNGEVVNVYSNTPSIQDGGNVALWWNNPFDYAKTVTFTINVLFIKHIEDSAGDDVIRNTMYPVGSVYISTNNANPNLLFGGTWRQIGQGRTLIGAGPIEANTVDTYGTVVAEEFNPSVNERGGKVNHTHFAVGKNGDLRAAIGAAQSSPAQIGYVATGKDVTDVDGNGNSNVQSNFNYVIEGTYVGQMLPATHYTRVYGHTDESPTLQPYLAVYIWERTA